MKRKTIITSVLATVTILLVSSLYILQAYGQIEDATKFSAVHVQATSLATATPLLHIRNDGSSLSVEVENSSGTPVWTIDSAGAAANTVDLNGNELTLDADADTSLTADTDDQLDFEIGGSDEITMTASTLNMNDHVIDQDVGTENVGVLPSICTLSITYTAAAGGSGTVCTVGAGEVWFIHSVYVNVTTNFDATGDDATLVVGDGDDANGFIDLADAELQTTDTEITGAPAGWQGFASTDTRGAFLAEGTGFVESGAETVDYLIDETSGETLTAGAATIYVVYTRIQ